MATKFSDSKGRYLQAQAKKTRQDKSNELKESIGSLDRRVQKALSGGDTDTAKDLRSRQKKFVDKLADSEVMRLGLDTGNKTSEGRPALTREGHNLLNDLMDQYYIDPTRNLKNTNPRAFAKMYPGSNLVQKFMPIVASKFGLGSLFKKDKQIPYSNPETAGLPGAEFPLGYAEALGTPEAYNLVNDDVLANSVDSMAPINVNATAAGLNLPDGYRVMPAGGSTFNDQIDYLTSNEMIEEAPGGGKDKGIFNNLNTGMNLLDYFNLRDKLPNAGVFQALPEGAEILREGYNKLRDDEGFDFDFRKKQLEYNRPLWGGNLQLYGNPDQAGIFYSKGLGV